MIQGLVGRKLGMTQIFDKFGNIVPVTLVEVGPCAILELKDSPFKVTLGFDSVKENRLTKPRQGFFKKVGVSPRRIVKEFDSTDNKDYKVGQELKADVFKSGDFVNISGVSIGKGFQGGMKRWHWSGGPAGHGSMHHRRVGSIGASADPARTLRGTNMPGQMGNKNVTAQGLWVQEVDVENNIVLIKGAVPGHKNSIVFIKLSKKRAFKELNQERVVVKHKVNPMKQSKAAAKGKK